MHKNASSNRPPSYSEEYINEMRQRADYVYAMVKNVNTQMINKADDIPYEETEFTDALDLAVTSNAVSVLKSFIDGNLFSITSAFNLRNLIEHYVFIKMDEEGEITQDQKELFNAQYLLIEHSFYNERNLSKKLVDREEMEASYQKGMEIFASKGFTENQVKRFIKTRAPFLCLKRFSFNEPIEKYMPGYGGFYSYLSRYIHPSSYLTVLDKDYYTNAFFGVLLTVIARYTRKYDKAINSLPYSLERVRLFGKPSPTNVIYRVLCAHKRQSEILTKISKAFEKCFEKNSYPTLFFNHLLSVFEDINSDAELGYLENAKMKFKVVAEMLANFSRIYFAGEKSRPLYRLMDIHENYKICETKQEPVPEKLIDEAYSWYKQAYPCSTVTRDKFLKGFKEVNGFLINENGEVESLSSMVEKYFDDLFDFMDTTKEDNLAETCKTMYSESQKMSHGCGYLYFANPGTWNDGVNVVPLLDFATTNLIRKLSVWFTAVALYDKTYEGLAKLLNESAQELYGIMKEKSSLLKIPRIPKDY